MFSYIFDLLPYKSSFRFVEEISFLDVNGVVGHYTLREDAFFYEDHFPGHPVTPGAILTEIMAQIGLVVLGIHLIVTGNPGSRGAANPGPRGAANPGSREAANPGPRGAAPDHREAAIAGAPGKGSVFP